MKNFSARSVLLLTAALLLMNPLSCTHRKNTSHNTSRATMDPSVPTMGGGAPDPAGMDPKPAGMDPKPAGMALAGLPTAGRWSCNTDSDCQNSCALGAVNAKWYQAWRGRIAECKDGCSSKGMKSRCVKSECVSIGRNNQPVSSCTKKSAPAYAFKKSVPVPDQCGRYKVTVKLPPKGPCKVDTDCGWVAKTPGWCNGPYCSRHYEAGTKRWVAAAQKLHATVCGGRRFKVCKRYKCLHRAPERAICKGGKCQVVLSAK